MKQTFSVKWNNAIHQCKGILNGWTSFASLCLLISLTIVYFFYKKICFKRYNRLKQSYELSFEKKNVYDRIQLLQKKVDMKNFFFTDNGENALILMIDKLLKKNGALDIRIDSVQEKESLMKTLHKYRFSIDAKMRFFEGINFLKGLKKNEKLFVFQQIEISRDEKKKPETFEEFCSPFLFFKIKLILFGKKSKT